MLPQTKVGGFAINNGIPKPATIAFKLPNEDNEWIIGLHDSAMMKMVKIRITGARSSTWLSSIYAADGSYDASCLTSFTYSCYKGTNNPYEINYEVMLVATWVRYISSKSTKFIMPEYIHHV